MSVQLLLLPLAAAFSPAALPQFRPACAVVGQPHAAAIMPAVIAPTAVCRVAPAVEMGLFGLGWAELGVIGVIVLFVLGPDKLVPYAKNLGDHRPQLAAPRLQCARELITLPLHPVYRQVGVWPQGGHRLVRGGPRGGECERRHAQVCKRPSR